MRLENLFVFATIGTAFVQSQAINCDSCRANPCGCSLFTCSKSFYKPQGFILNKGFQGCQESDSPLYDINFIRSLQGTCNCPYIDLDENCQPVRNSGIKIGTGIDLKFREASDLLSIGVPQTIVTKLEPFLSQKEGLIDIISKNAVTLTDAEALQFDQIMMDSISASLKSQFNYNVDYLSQYGEIPVERPKYQNLTRGVRSVLLNHEIVFGERKNYPDFWNYALTMQGGKMITLLDNTTEFIGTEADQQQDVLKYCFEKCSSSSKADVMIVMDASGSIGSSNFVKQIDFVKNLINSMEISEDEQKVGIIIYSGSVRQVQTFTSNKASLISMLTNYLYDGGGTYTNQALERGVTEFTNNGRSNVIKLLFVITDGQSSDGISTTTIQKYKNLGVIRYAIGIGSGINYQELRTISGDNSSDSQRVYTVDNFDAIKNILYSVKTTQCTQALEYQSINTDVPVTLGNGNTYAHIEKSDFNSTSIFITLQVPPNPQGVQNISTLQVYYSHDFELPCQYVNDGEGVIKNDTIELNVVFQKEQIYLGFTNTGDTPITANLEVNRLQEQGCQENCALCLVDNSNCTQCRPGYTLEGFTCVEIVIETESDGLSWWIIFLILFFLLLLLAVVVCFVKKQMNKKLEADLARHENYHRVNQ